MTKYNQKKAIKASIKRKLNNTFFWQFYIASRNSRALKNKGILVNDVVYNFNGKQRQFENMLHKMQAGNKCENEYFYYSIRKDLLVINSKRIISNLSINYEKILNNGLRELIKKEVDNRIIMRNNLILQDVISFCENMSIQLTRINTDNSKRHAENLRNMIDRPAESLEEACQRILLWNSFLWQSQHNLLGFGRLDKVLEPFYNEGKQKGEDAEYVVEQFLIAVHKYYDYKSAEMLGDTGQVIVLGGLEKNKSYFVNELSYIFLRSIRKLHLPDPKFIVRASQNMPVEFLREAILTNASGIGNPLISNDDIIIPCLNSFYNDNSTACNYVTTACWAPVSYGNSISQCNVSIGNYVIPLLNLLNKKTKTKSFEEFFDQYLNYLGEYLSEEVSIANQIKWEEDPLLTFFVDGCIDKEKDISAGGAKYNDYGVQSIGFPNVVNSIYNIKKYCFESQKYSLTDICDILEHNYSNNDGLFNELKENDIRFGCDDDELIDISNKIIEFTSDFFKNEKNCFNDNYKFGLSSPVFIKQGKETKASFDGRKSGMPLAVQITPDTGISHTELGRFASKLHYGAYCSNGSVMDIMFTYNMVEKHFDKIVDYIIGCIRLGVFQMQFNILSYKVLMDAKNNPDNYKNLIVRVWGFNAYFNDLPNDYKDILIERAKKLEGVH